MKVVILCGGQGTRIRDVADNIPKPMIPIGNKPILWHIMKYYASFGHTEFILLLGYKSDVIKDYFLNYEVHNNDFTINLGNKNSLQIHNSHPEKNWKITFAETGLNAMTGARIRKIKKYINDNESFLLTYGDGLGDIDITKLIDFHKKNGKTLTLTGVMPAGRFGELLTNGQGEITDFKEKPKTVKSRINGGFFVANYELFDYIDEGDNEVFEQSPMKRLVKKRELMQFNHDGFWQPMDTHKEFHELNKLYSNNEAPWVKWE
jgi:glucose-1-phosphate cytidylyltransferase